MPRATTKIELVKMAEAQFGKLQGMIDAMSDEEQSTAFCFDAAAQGKEAHWNRDKNLRDVLVHLYEWHELLLNWEKENASGNARPFLPPPYNWKSYGEMNVGFWQKHQNTPLKEAKEMLNKSHAAVMAVINRYTDEQLFTKEYFTWTGTSSFGQYCISATASHYDWAIKKLKVQIKSLK